MKDYFAHCGRSACDPLGPFASSELSERALICHVAEDHPEHLTEVRRLAQAGAFTTHGARHRPALPSPRKRRKPP